MIDERSQLRKHIEEKQRQLDGLDSRILSQKQKLANYQDERVAAERRLGVLQTEVGRNKSKVKEAEVTVVSIEKDISVERAKLKDIKRK